MVVLKVFSYQWGDYPVLFKNLLLFFIYKQSWKWKKSTHKKFKSTNPIKESVCISASVTKNSINTYLRLKICVVCGGEFVAFNYILFSF